MATKTKQSTIVTVRGKANVERFYKAAEESRKAQEKKPKYDFSVVKRMGITKDK